MFTVALAFMLLGQGDRVTAVKPAQPEAILELLRSSKAADRSEGLQLAETVDDTRVLDAVLPALADRDVLIRRRAVECCAAGEKRWMDAMPYNGIEANLDGRLASSAMWWCRDWCDRVLAGLSTCAESKDSLLRKGAIRALACFAEPWRTGCGNGRQDSSGYKAAERLKKIADSRMSEVECLLLDSDPDVAYNVARVLPQPVVRRNAMTFRAMLVSSDRRAKLAALGVLGEAGLECSPEAARLLADPDELVRQNAQCSCKMDTGAIVNGLMSTPNLDPLYARSLVRMLFIWPRDKKWDGVRLGLLDHPAPEVRAAALSQLVMANARVADAKLIAMAHDPSSGVRAEAITCLSVGSLAGLNDVLIQALGDPDRDLRNAASRCAGDLKDPALWPGIQRALILGVDSPYFAACYLEGDESAARVESCLISKEQRLRAFVAEVISMEPTEGARLRALVADPNDEVAESACNGAAEYGGPTVWPILARRLASAGPSLRLRLLRCFNDCSSLGLIDAIEPFCQDPDRGIRIAAKQAIRSMKEAAPPPPGL